MDLPGDARETTARPLVSVVIPTFNRAPQLRRVLRALDRQRVPARTFEVLVADDGSTDDTPRVLAEPYRFALRTVRQPNQGPAAARNAAIERAAGEILLFIDDDVVPQPGLIERHLARHEERGLAVIGRLARPAGGRQPIWAQWEIQTLERQYDDMLAGRYQPCARQFFTANASVRREDVVSAGMFDPRFRRAEDVELAYRLEDRGVRFVFASDAVVLHDTPRTLGAWMRVAEQYGRYDVLMWQRGVRYMLEMTAEDLAHARKAPLRAAARALVGRAMPMRALRLFGPLFIRMASAARLGHVSLALCSAVFNILYWDAFASAIGGRERFWALMASELHPQVAAPAAE